MADRTNTAKANYEKRICKISIWSRPRRAKYRYLYVAGPMARITRAIEPAGRCWQLDFPCLGFATKFANHGKGLMKVSKIPRVLVVSVLTAGAMSVAPVSAIAAVSAVAITNVNLRAGPGINYPIVAALPTRAALTLYGCTPGAVWCDISWGRERGWISANHIQVFYRGAPTLVSPVVAPAIGVGIVTFSQAYWQNYYVGRPWYGQWQSHYNPAPRVAAGCVDGRCGGVVATPGHFAVGHCADGTCSGTSFNRGPFGHVWVRHGSAAW